MNDTFFRSGGMVQPDARLIALVYDENGINATGNGIGRDLMVYLDRGTPNEKVYVVNDFYRSEINSYQRGKIEYDISSLTPGWHTVTVRVWDIFNNASEASLPFRVSRGGDLEVSNVTAYPNPLPEGGVVRFRFEHNRPGDNLTTELVISDLAGRTLSRKTQVLEKVESVSNTLHWDPATSPFGGGMALYKLIVRDGSGIESVHHGRIIYTSR